MTLFANKRLEVFLGRAEEINGPRLAIEASRRTCRRLLLGGNVPTAQRACFDCAVAPFVGDVPIWYISPVEHAQYKRAAAVGGRVNDDGLWEEPFGVVMAAVGRIDSLDRMACLRRMERLLSEKSVVEC